MSKASETMREVKRQRDSAINAVQELVDMIDGNGAMAEASKEGSPWNHTKH